MDCDEARRLLHRLLDLEIEPADRVRLEAHLAVCASCVAARAALHRLGEAVRGGASRYRAPDSLAARIAASLPDDTVGKERARAPARLSRARSSRWLPLAASVMLTALVSSGLTFTWTGQSDESRADDEVVAAHIRSLMADHLTDVASSDQHTVRPWFSGRIDLAPPVRDLAADGFPLVGGRLDYLDGRASAALVYRHGPHVINVFVRPAADTGAMPLTLHSRQGYLIGAWAEGGLAYTAISDVGVDEMTRLASLLAAGTVPTPGPPG